MYKKIKFTGVMLFCVVAFFNLNALAQEFKIDTNRTVSITQKKLEAGDENGEYLSEVLVHVKARLPQVLEKIYSNSEAATINDVFGLDMDSDGVPEIVLISSEDIPTDSLEGNVGAYVDVKVYKVKDDRYEKNERFTNIFSGGVDKAVDLAADKLAYKFIYPHKTRKEIEQFVATQFFKSFVADGCVDYVMQSKTTIYKEPYVFESKMYLIQGDKIEVVEISGGWVTFSYVSAKKGKIQASAKLTDLKI
ncbi:MAG TPA: hypothetical protein VN030_01395 [Cellvibrio sp.]|nr:hypothetical protein [Cellvibrio sp.]